MVLQSSSIPTPVTLGSPSSSNLTSPNSSVELSIYDPVFYTPPSNDYSWQPPIPWEELSLDRDSRAWVTELAEEGLRSKADSAATCGRFYRKILEYSDHWVRVGRTTCHLLTCRNCGRGKMRAHRAFMKNPAAYSFMVDQDSRTARLSIRYSSPAADLPAYSARIQRDKHYLSAFRRRLRREFGGEVGVLSAVELDATRTDTIFRLYCVGSSYLSHRWISETWQSIVGLQASAESHVHYRQNSPKAFRELLDSYVDVLVLSGSIRVEWELAFDGIRMTSTSGCLRGIKLEDKLKIEDEYRSGDPAAPFGRCPCGCQGIIEKSSYHQPLTLTQLSTDYKLLDFGPLSAYSAYRSKVDVAILGCNSRHAQWDVNSPSPPGFGRFGPN